MEEIIACELTQWAFLVKAFCVCVSIIPCELPISPAPRSPPGAGFIMGLIFIMGHKGARAQGWGCANAM